MTDIEMDRHRLLLPQTNKTHINNSIKVHTNIIKPFTEEKIFMAIEHMKKYLLITILYLFNWKASEKMQNLSDNMDFLKADG